VPARLSGDGFIPLQLVHAVQTTLPVRESKDLLRQHAQRIAGSRGAGRVGASRQKDARNQKRTQRTQSVPDFLRDFRLGLPGAMQRQCHLQVHVRDFFA
jgi:hypothetical protein